MSIFSSLSGIILIILGFGVLIFIHELGHFLAAKWAGIRTEAFAVGMGPVMVGWRKGIGFALGSTDRKVLAKCAKHASELSDAELEKFGVGETEYSLRWLPLGGFVKMLGQEDANPSAVSDDPRSYTVCPIGKRMVVVSAGVIMNVLLALVLFMWAFMVGVRFEGPVIGSVAPMSPAARTMAMNAADLGVTEPGLVPGDEVVTIDGDPARTFADIQIATAMSRPGTTVALSVRRLGMAGTLDFVMTPEPSPENGLLSIGVSPGRSSRLLGGRSTEQVEEYLDRAGLLQAGVGAGMELVSVEGRDVTTYGELSRMVADSGGRDLVTRWSSHDETGARVGELVEATVTPEPDLQDLFQAAPNDEDEVLFDRGLLGLTPLIKVQSLAPTSPNTGMLLPGDIIVGIGDFAYPRLSQFKQVARAHAGSQVEVRVERDSALQSVQARVERSGRLGVVMGWAEDRPITTAPVTETVERDMETGEQRTLPTAVGAKAIPPGSRLLSLGGTPIDDWPQFRRELQRQTEAARNRDEGATLQLLVAAPSQPPAPVDLDISAAEIVAVHDLEWTADVPYVLFEPVYRTLSAEGSPARAIAMGFTETHKTIMLTYLTIDRLVRGSVGVKQLRGPVGIIDLGAKILPKGFMYFIFFLGMISVNLAVINFLPLPIVDGGLFLFLIYEKIKGRPPSVQFQNAATIVGLFIIGTVFVVTFYNDIARLIG